MENTKIIAVSGKGGVGKTSISSIVVKLLAEEKPDAKILAIDADPAVGLAVALNIKVEKTLDEIRVKLIDGLENANSGEDKKDLLHNTEYEVFSALVEKDRFAFLSVGRPETAGCYCKINSYLKDVIEMLAEKFDYVVIDGEAGIEQVNRRVMEKVTHLLLVSDSSKKGTNVIQTIVDVADKMVMYDKAGAIINRIKDDSVKDRVDTGRVEILNFIEEDENLNDFDIDGKNIFDLPKDSKSVAGVKVALEKIGIL